MPFEGQLGLAGVTHLRFRNETGTTALRGK